MSLNTLDCRFCGEKLEQTFLYLGETPLANSYLPLDADVAREPCYPLHARVCEKCYLVQVESVVPPEQIFSHYAYYSSYSSSWVGHAKAFTHTMIERFQLNQQHRVVEIASNDGYLLRHFVELGIPCLGIEPAKNVAQAAIELGVPTEVQFFGLDLAKKLLARDGYADLIIANNVLAHVPDLNDFVAGLAKLLNIKGILSVEFPHLLKLIQQTQFDTIYHEHYCNFSLLSVEKLFAVHGLKLFDVEELTTHGGSLRLLASRSDGAFRAESQGLLKVRYDEQLAKLDMLDSYQEFSVQVNRICQEFMVFLQAAAADKKIVAAYGAAAKGNTFLNYCGITHKEIICVVDKNPVKQGHLLPGSHIPIFAPDRIVELKPDYLLILPWNLADEISQEMLILRSWGGQFVTAIPNIRVF